MEGNFENIKTEQKETLESRDLEIMGKLNSLGVMFDYSINNEGNLVYNFYDAKRLEHAAFLLHTDNKIIVYQALHFGEDKFKEPESKKEVTPDELVQYLSEKFPDANKIIFSCCNPDRAKTFFAETNGKIIFIGTGNGTYSTWYNENEKMLTSVKNSIID